MKRIIIIIILILCLSSSYVTYSQQDSIYRDVSELKKNIIKIKPSSFAFGYTQITYERSLSPKRSFEIGVGLIGLGYDLHERNPSGFAVKGGYKFYFGKREVKRSFMKGFYFMPELAFTMYDKNVRFYDDSFESTLEQNPNSTYYYIKGEARGERLTKYYVAAIASIGHQWNLKRFVIDYNVGIGGGYYNKTRSPESLLDFGENEHHFGFHGGNDGKTYVVFNFNFKIGYMF